MKRRDFLLRTAVLGGAGIAAAGISFFTFAGHAPDALFDHSFPDIDGKQFAMRGFLGKPVVVNFWATWCPPCVREMPDIDALRAKYPGIQFLGLGIDIASNVRIFLQKVHVSYPLLLAGNGGIALMRPLGNTAGGLPFTVVFDAQGQVVHKVLGQIKPDVLAQTLDGLAGSSSS